MPHRGDAVGIGALDVQPGGGKLAATVGGRAPGDASKRHFGALDGLRGLAAIAVVIFHRRWFFDAPIVDHAFLAVDFFFILSGFVIGFAYEDRLRAGKMTFAQFVRVRVVRLWPLIVIGALLGTWAAVAHALDEHWTGGVAKALLALPLAILLLPAPPVLASQPFAINQPSWSLMYEMAANLFHAALAPRLTDRVLATLVMGFGVALAVILMTVKVNLGFSWPWWALVLAVPRVMFPFLFGVLLQRWHAAGRLPAIGAPFWALGLALLAVMMVPSLPGQGNLLVQLAAVFVVFPLIVVSGSQREPAGRWSPVAAFSAELSYPIYILHAPMLALLEPWAALLPVGRPLQLLAMVAVIVPTALFTGRYVDQPLRRRLSAWLSSPRRQTRHA